jgi:hypothetical protein
MKLILTILAAITVAATTASADLPWKGTIYDFRGNPHTGILESIVDGKYKFIEKGDAHYYYLDELHPVTRAEAGLSTAPTDIAALKADLIRREKNATIEAARRAMQASFDAEWRAKQEQKARDAKADARSAEALRIEKRKLEALETLAREAEYRRLLGR